ncbi:MAG: class I adenylate-forming enzyme family protein [Candidatus Hermodarchaeota archaeon]
MVKIEYKDGVPMVTPEMYEKDYADRHLLHGVVQKWAKEKPEALAIIDADGDGREITYKELDDSATGIALKLLDMGYEKGDFIATSLPMLPEHIFLMYACFKIGVIIAPLDLRLKPPEVIRNVSLIQARGYIHLGKTPHADFGQLALAVRKNCPFIKDFVQFSPPDECVEGSISIFQVGLEARDLAEKAKEEGAANLLLKKLLERTQEVKETDGCLVVYTTGSTGYPKPALLSHQNITAQNLGLGLGLGVAEDDRMLVNLPPSHVGGTTEQLMTTFFFGGTNVILHIFDPVKTLKAIQDYKVTVLGQIPALFELEWRLPNYNEFNLSALKFVLYAGQEGTRPFVEKLSKMAPKMGTGYGLTECAGFCTYSPVGGTVDEILASVGYDMPFSPVTIRQPIKSNGSAGDILPDGEIGEICLEGPQVFLGYVNNEEATKEAISMDGVLYTGDVGYKDEKGIHLSGRAKWVVKPKGYQVFPGEVEAYIAELTKVASVAVVGVPHEVYSEGIIAFVEKKPDIKLTAEEIMEHCKGIASYKRPGHVIILEQGQIPLNRVGKTDYVIVKQKALEEIDKLRAEGKWDK